MATLADPRLPPSGPAAPPVAIVDVSASVGKGPLAPPPDVRIAPRWVAVAETLREVEGRAAAPGIAREGTRLVEALRWAAEQHPGRDLWVFTDGRATDGDPAIAARAVRARGGRVHVSAPLGPAADVALLSARATSQADAPVVVRALVGASTSGSARLLLVRDGRTVDEAEIACSPGVRERIVLRDESPSATGAAAYSLHLTPGRGTPNDDPANDRLSVGVPPVGRRSVLIWGDLALGALVAPDRSFVGRFTPSLEPGALETADCVVVTSLPWRRIGDERVRQLARFVGGGGRLLLLGGPRSWGPGGWSGTSLESRLSPLKVLGPPGAGRAVVLALDHSGSTGRAASGALVHLRRAVREVLQDLKPGEKVAVLPFSRVPAAALLEPGWVASEGGSEARQALEAALEALYPGDATDIPAAILAAAERVAAAEADERRVLLLTDGDPDQRLDPERLQAVRRRLDALGVTFGAVVSGMPEAARALREALARAPEDVVLLEDASTIPERLLGSLARRRAEAEVRDGPAAVRWTAGVAPADIEAVTPSKIHALERAEGSEILAEAVLFQPAGEMLPFAARRTVGGGEVVALSWGPEWEADPQRAGLPLLGVLRRLLDAADRGVQAEVDEAGALTVHLPSARTAGALSLVGDGWESRLVEIRPGVFRGTPPSLGAGIPRVVLPGGERPLRLPVRPAPEHRGAGVDEPALRRLAEAGGGSRLAAGDAPPPGRPPPGAPLAPWLLVLGAILLVLDRAWTEGRTSRVRRPEEEVPTE